MIFVESNSNPGQLRLGVTIAQEIVVMNTCQNPICGQPIEVEPGHRPRQYCNDACKQTAYRLRKEAAAEQERLAAAQEAERRERERLRQHYGDLLPETIELLFGLRKQGHYRLAETFGCTVLAEVERARRTEAEERNQLVEEVMLLGEKMGYSAMTLGRLNDHSGPGDFTILGGVDCWSNFVSHASIEMLRQARNAALYCTEGYERARQQLKALSKQS